MITNLTTLKSSVKDWMGRDDITDSQIAVAIQICEGNFTYGVDYGSIRVEPLRCRAMEVSEPLTIDNQKVDLPDGYLAFRNIYLNSNPIRNLKFLTPEVLREMWPINVAGEPSNFTIEGESIVFGSAPDATYEADVVYYKKVEGLTDLNPSNWVLENRSDIYLYGVMAELEQMLDGPNHDKWFARFASAVNALNGQDAKDRYSGSTLVMSTSPRQRRGYP